MKISGGWRLHSDGWWWRKRRDGETATGVHFFTEANKVYASSASMTAVCDGALAAAKQARASE